MEISLAALADAANVTTDGKLNILGQFDTIGAFSFPVVHAQATLVIRVHADALDAGKQTDIRVDLIDEDGRSIWGVTGQVQIGNDPKPGQFVHSNQIINIRGLRFEKPGRYRFRIKLGTDERPTEVAFQLVLVERPQ